MPRSSSLRRAVAATACTGVAVALAWIPAGSAQAAVQSAFIASVSTDATYTGAGTGDCNLLTGTAQNQSAESDFSGGTRHASTSTSATFVNSNDATDKVHVKASSSSTITVRKSGQDMSSFALSATGKVTIKNDLANASACRGGGEGLGQALVSFTEHKAGWFYLTRDTAKNSISTFVVANNDLGELVTLDFWEGDESHATSRAFLAPGSYQIAETQVGLAVGNGGIFAKSAGADRRSAKVSAALHARFVKAGSAVAAAKGAGTSYVAFPGSVTCGQHQATLRWKSSAGHVLSGAFLVNGTKKASDSSPRSGEKIVLKHLSSTADLKITAKLRLKGGGKATATRTYASCQG
jgi:hypothetical protein